MNRPKSARPVHPIRVIIVLVVSLLVVLLSGLVASTSTSIKTPRHVNTRSPHGKPTAGQEAVEALRRGQHSGPVIYLQDSQSLPVTHVGEGGARRNLAAEGAEPLSMATGDFDEDGITDLVVGYGAPGGGAIALHRGNLDAFAPQSEESFQA